MVRTKEEMNDYNKDYYEKNREKINEIHKAYRQTEAGKKSHRIARWKRYGVKHDDFNSLYEVYINTKFCEECNIELVEGLHGANKKTLDHDHTTGKFRNVICHTCNMRRAIEDRKKI